MCGHVGLAGDSTGKNKRVFEEMLIADTLRGPHSTGVMVASRHNNDVEVVKAVGPTYTLMGQKLYEKAMNLSTKCIIGHNRYATMGKVTTWNAHPFEFKDIVGAHNGTIDWWAIKNLHRNELYDTDSEAVFSHLNANGLQDTVDTMEGAWALVWYGKTDNTINFIRNDKRDLYYAYSKDECSLFWSSEPGLLKWIASRNQIDLHEDKIWQVPEDTHMKWTIPKTITDKFEPAERQKIVKANKFHNNWVSPQNHQGYARNDRYYESYASSTTPKQQTVIPFVPKVVKPADTKNFRPPYKWPDGKVVNKESFNKAVQGGCVMCQETNINWGEFVQFLKPDMDGRELLLCEECYKDDDIRDLCKDLM